MKTNAQRYALRVKLGSQRDRLKHAYQYHAGIMRALRITRETLPQQSRARLCSCAILLHEAARIRKLIEVVKIRIHILQEQHDATA